MSYSSLAFQDNTYLSFQALQVNSLNGLNILQGYLTGPLPPTGTLAYQAGYVGTGVSIPSFENANIAVSVHLIGPSGPSFTAGATNVFTTGFNYALLPTGPSGYYLTWSAIGPAVLQ